MFAGRMATRQLLLDEDSELWSINTRTDYHEQKIEAEWKALWKPSIEAPKVGINS